MNCELCDKEIIREEHGLCSVLFGDMWIHFHPWCYLDFQLLRRTLCSKP